MDSFNVSISSYRQRGSGDDDPQCRRVDIGPVSVWFSYSTPVAFMVAGEKLVARENSWGPTTGKHLNAIDGGRKADRVDGDTFQRLLSERVGRFFFPRDLDANCPAYAVADWLRDRGMHRAADAVTAAEAVA